MSDPDVLRMGHRRLASVGAPSGPRRADPRLVELRRRSSDGVEAVEVTRVRADANDSEATLDALRDGLRGAHAAGAVYAFAWVRADDAAAVRCLLRAGFEPELAGPGHETAWNRLLEAESRAPHLL